MASEQLRYTRSGFDASYYVVRRILRLTNRANRRTNGKSPEFQIIGMYMIDDPCLYRQW